MLNDKPDPWPVAHRVTGPLPGAIEASGPIALRMSADGVLLITALPDVEVTVSHDGDTLVVRGRLKSKGT
jgi:hypothetical protein